MPTAKAHPNAIQLLWSCRLMRNQGYYPNYQVAVAVREESADGACFPYRPCPVAPPAHGQRGDARFGPITLNRGPSASGPCPSTWPMLPSCRPPVVRPGLPFKNLSRRQIASKTMVLKRSCCECIRRGG